MNWKLQKVNNLEMRKMELQEELFMASDFDEMFEIKQQINAIDKEIREIDRQLANDHKEC